jgi:hypothetical protein
MINMVKEIDQATVLNQSAAATRTPANAKQQLTVEDTVQISEEAKAAMQEATETHADLTIQAKCGDLEAQRLLAQTAAQKELLGIG